MPGGWLTKAWLKAKAPMNRSRLQRDLEEEIPFHLEMRSEKNRAMGIGANQARAEARRRFGNVTLLKEYTGVGAEPIHGGALLASSCEGDPIW
jgi:putative ABC transport system permease protein